MCTVTHLRQMVVVCVLFFLEFLHFICGCGPILGAMAVVVCGGRDAIQVQWYIDFVVREGSVRGEYLRGLGCG
jgi:hypothetical protein